MGGRRGAGVPDADGDSIVVYTSWLRLLLTTLFSYSIVGLLILAFVHDEHIAGQIILEPIIFVLLEALVIPFAVDYTVRLLFRSPILVISADGISVGLGLYGRELIEWRDIGRLRASRQRRFRAPPVTVFAIELSNPIAVFASRDWLRRVIWRLSVRPPLYDVTLPQPMLPMPVDELLDLIRQRYHNELHHNRVRLYVSEEVANRSKR